MFDFFIVGAGPAGTYLGYTLSKKGYKVCITDHTKIGAPLKCSGHVSKELFNFIPYKRGIVERKIYGARFHFNNTTRTISRKRPFSFVINRPRLDRFIASLARKEGCVFKKEKFLDMKKDDNGITVMTDKNKYKTKMLAGCDGPLSDVRERAKIQGPKKYLQGIFSYIDKQNSQNFVDVYHDQVKDFFAWKIPRSGSYEYGLATGLKRNAKAEFKDFCGKHNISAERIYSGIIPIGPPRKICSSSVFLVGDAAAQVKPFTGGGIIYSMIAAKIAAETVVPDDPKSVEKYDSKWRNKLLTEIRLGNMIKNIYRLPVCCKSILFSSIKLVPESVQMDKPTTFIKKLA